MTAEDKLLGTIQLINFWVDLISGPYLQFEPVDLYFYALGLVTVLIEFVFSPTDTPAAIDNVTVIPSD